MMKRRLSSLQLDGVKASLGGTLAAQKLFTRSFPSNRNTCTTGRIQEKYFHIKDGEIQQNL